MITIFFHYADWIDGTFYGHATYHGREFVCVRVDGGNQWRVDCHNAHTYDTSLLEAIERLEATLTVLRHGR